MIQKKLINKYSIGDSNIKRDKHFIINQNQVGSALSAIGSALTLILPDEY